MHFRIDAHMVLVAVADAAAAAHHHLLALASAWRQLLMAALCDPPFHIHLHSPNTHTHTPTHTHTATGHAPPGSPLIPAWVRPAQNENETVAKSHKTAKKLL